MASPPAAPACHSPRQVARRRRARHRQSRPVVATTTRCAGRYQSADEWRGSSVSPRPVPTGCCATRRACPASHRSARRRWRMWWRWPAGIRRLMPRIGQAGRVAKATGIRCARCSESGRLSSYDAGQKDQRQEAASSRRYTGIATARRCASGGVHSRPFAGGMAAVTIVLTTKATLAIGSVAEIVRTKAKLDMNKPFRIYRSTNKQHLSGCPTKPSSLRGDAAERRG
jgi:hypothetical protein